MTPRSENRPIWVSGLGGVLLGVVLGISFGIVVRVATGALGPGSPLATSDALCDKDPDRHASADARGPWDSVSVSSDSASSPDDSNSDSCVFARHRNESQEKMRSLELTTESLLETIADLPTTRARLLVAGAILLRKAATDPPAALRLAGSLAPEPAVALPIATGMLDELGWSRANLDAVVAVFPTLDAPVMRGLLIDFWALRSPREAFDAMLAHGPGVAPRDAVIRVAEILTALDPSSARSSVRLQPDGVSRTLIGIGVVRELGMGDLLEMLDFMLEMDPWRTPVEEAAFDVLVTAGADVCLSLIRETAGRSRRQSGLLLHAAVRDDALAVRDALEWLESDPKLGDFRNLMPSVAFEFGAAHPELAVEWALSRPEDSGGLLMQVVAGITRSDPERALELATGVLLRELEKQGSSDAAHSLASILRGIAGTQRVSPRVLLERVRSLPIDPSASLLGLHDYWMAREPEEALAWLNEVKHTLSPDDLSQFAYSVANHDLEQALRFVAELPAEQRAAAMRPVVGIYAESDPEAAIRWLASSRDQVGRGDGLQSAFESLAGRNPSLARTLLGQEVGAGLPDRAAVLGEIALESGVREPDATRAWLESLPAGHERDVAVSRFVQARYPASLPDTELLSLFSSRQAREVSLATSLRGLAEVDLARAEALIDERIESPALRRHLRDRLEMLSRRPVSARPLEGAP